MAGLGLFSALDVAISGMFVSQLATQVVNHNIANANTPGYSRQSLRISSNTPLAVSYGAIGRGAQSDGVTRAQNAFLKQQLVDQNALLGDYAAMDETLRSIEQIMGSMEDDRLGTALNDFFSSWGDLATPPMTDGKRTSVVKQAERLALQFNEIDDSLASLERDTRLSYDAYVGEVNMLLSQVGELNSQIVANTVGDQKPNDLMDQRDQLLDRLSSISRFTSVDRSDGTADVIFEGRALVTRGTVNELRVEEYELPGGGPGRRVVFGGRDPVDVPFQSGALAGYERMANETVPALRKQVDALAAQVIRQVNALHQDGVTAGGSGISMFMGSSAATMSVNGAIVNNVNLVATGRTGEDGDNELALEIAQLGTTLQDGADFTINEFYSGMIVDIATERGTYDALRTGQESIVEAARGRLESQRGVNLDEELANLVMFQRTYEANARVVQTVNSMLDTLVNGMI